MEYLTGGLILALAFVNGWTDAPNAIATAVTTRALSARSAVLLGTACNLLGLVGGFLFAEKLLDTIVQLSDGLTPAQAASASAAAMTACVLWAVFAWYFGIPTSESHGMLAGAIGGSAAFVGARALLSPAARLAFFGLFFALVVGMVCGWGFDRLLYYVCRDVPRTKAMPHIRRLQKCGAVAAACLHGAQDGQKFLGMFLLCGLVTRPAVAVLPIALALTLGTALGGFRIIRRVGGLVPLSPEQGLAAEGASVLTVLCATIFGIPVSTTHAKTASILGAGLSKNKRKIRLGSVLLLVGAWLATFPICGGLGFLLVRLFARL